MPEKPKPSPTIEKMTIRGLDRAAIEQIKARTNEATSNKAVVRAVKAYPELRKTNDAQAKAIREMVELADAVTFARRDVEEARQALKRAEEHLARTLSDLETETGAARSRRAYSAPA